MFRPLQLFNNTNNAIYNQPSVQSPQPVSSLEESLQQLLAQLNGSPQTQTDQYSPSSNSLFPSSAYSQQVSNPVNSGSVLPPTFKSQTVSPPAHFSNNRPAPSSFSNPFRTTAAKNTAPTTERIQNGEKLFGASSADNDSFDTAQRRGNCGLVSFMNGLLAVKGWSKVSDLMSKYKTKDMERVADKLGSKAGAAGDGGSSRSTWARMAKMVGIAGKAGTATLNSIAKILDSGRPVEMSVNAGRFWGGSRGRGQDHAVLAIGREEKNGKDGFWMVDSGKPNNGPKWYSMDFMKKALGGLSKSDVFAFKDKMADSQLLPESLRKKLFANKSIPTTTASHMASNAPRSTNRPATMTASRYKKTGTSKVASTSSKSSSARPSRTRYVNRQSRPSSVRHA